MDKYPGTAHVTMTLQFGIWKNHHYRFGYVLPLQPPMHEDKECPVYSQHMNRRITAGNACSATDIVKGPPVRDKTEETRDLNTPHIRGSAPSLRLLFANTAYEDPPAQGREVVCQHYIQTRIRRHKRRRSASSCALLRHARPARRRSPGGKRHDRPQEGGRIVSPN